MSLCTLEQDAVHVWMTRPDEIKDPDRLSRYRTLLSDAEAERHARFHFARHRHAFLVTRATVRTLLSRYHSTAPGDWRFETNEHGRPEISPEFGTDLKFNISHTDGLIACAITRARDIGIDVECAHRRGKTTEIANRFFAPSEVEALQALPSGDQRHRFFVYWTLKESYIKARGMGLAIPLDQFAFRLPEDHPDRDAIEIWIHPDQRDDPASWRFRQWTLAPTDDPTHLHHAALAIRSGPQESIRVVESTWTP